MSTYLVKQHFGHGGAVGDLFFAFYRYIFRVSVIRFMSSTFILSEDRRGVIFIDPLIIVLSELIKIYLNIILWFLRHWKSVLEEVFKMLPALILRNLALFSIYFLSNRLFFQNIFFVNFANQSTVDEGSNNCRAKGKGRIMHSVSKWNKQLGYQKTQWSNKHIFQNQIWSLKISFNLRKISR